MKDTQHQKREKLDGIKRPSGTVKFHFLQEAELNKKFLGALEVSYTTATTEIKEIGVEI